MKNHAKKISVLIVLTILLSAAQPVFGQIEEVISRSFSLTHKRVEDFVELAQALLSKKGQVTVSEKMNLFVIKDYPQNLDLVDSLLADFDRPSRQILTIIHLLTGERDQYVEWKLPADTSFMNLTRDLFDYNVYEEIDKIFIRVEEGLLTFVDVAGGKYQIKFYVEGIGNELKFRTFALSETASSIRGKFQKDIVSTATNINNGDTALFGAVGIGRNKTLFIIVTATLL